MSERQIEHYHMKGYEAFFTEAMPSIKTILDEKLVDKEGHFAMAIVEAVQNAAMYSKAGARNVQLDIDLVATETDIAVKVSADTKDFDVLAYRQSLGRMARDKSLREKDWSDFTKSISKGRGYFTMLMGVECLYVDVTGKSVTLCAGLPYRKTDIAKKIKDIVPRFMLERNGVIIEGEEAV